MPALGSRVTTTTSFKIMPLVVDTILNSNVFCTRVLSKAKKWSGEQIKFPVKVSKNTTGTSFSGFDTFSTAAIDNRVLLAFSPKFYQMTAALPLDELSANQVSETKIIDLAALTLQSTAQDMADDLGTIFYSDGTGNGSKDPLGLNAIVDDGSTVGTFGGQSRTTYTTLKATLTASGGTLTLAKMSTLYNAISSGSQKPTLGLTTEAVFNFYEQLLQPQERIMKDTPMMKADGTISKEGTGYIGGTGFTGLMFKGFPILADEKATSQAMYFINENFVDWYALPMAMTEPVKYAPVDLQGNDYNGVLGLGFSWSGWVKPTNSAAVVGHVYLGGELVSDNPKRQGQLTGITGV